MIDPGERKRRMQAAFRAAHGRDAQHWVRAPGRVDLMGSHTDYNSGCVMTLPIDRDTWIAGSPRADGLVNVRSMNVEGEYAFSLPIGPAGPRCNGWALYVEGVAIVLEQAGHPLRGADLLIHGTVPIASGLSSSASLEVATATAFEALGGFQLGGLEKARLCQRAENQVVGVQCGLLDQYSSAMGERDRAMLLDCRNDTHGYTELPAGLRTVVCDTGTPRQLAGSEFDQRRDQCEAAVRFFSGVDASCRSLRDVPLALFEQHEHELPPLLARRARFVIEEHARVGALAHAFATNDLDTISRLMADSYTGARTLYEICVPAMDEMLAAMLGGPGVVGARQTGAGFGGCMVALVEEHRVHEFCREVAERYRRSTSIEPSVYPVRIAAGAGPVSDPL